jgi:ankyrin repeat protein
MLRREIYSVLVLLALLACSSPAEKSDEQLFETLTGAVSRDDLPGVIELLERGADPNLRDENGSVPLVVASLEASPAAVTALLAAGADPNVYADDWVFTPLMAAATRDDAEGSDVVAALVAAGADACVVAAEEPSPALFGNRFLDMTALEIAESVGNDASVTAVAKVARC